MVAKRSESDKWKARSRQLVSNHWPSAFTLRFPTFGATDSLQVVLEVNLLVYYVRKTMDDIKNFRTTPQGNKHIIMSSPWRHHYIFMSHRDGIPFRHHKSVMSHDDDSPWCAGSRRSIISHPSLKNVSRYILTRIYYWRCEELFRRLNASMKVLPDS